MKKFITEKDLEKLKADTGGGCSVCGATPCVNIDGTYWLCGGCADLDLSTAQQRVGYLEEALGHIFDEAQEYNAAACRKVIVIVRSTGVLKPIQATAPTTKAPNK